MNPQKKIAHKRNSGEEQTIEAHLLGTASYAERFANEFGNGDWGRVLGLWHDLGKYNPDWQTYIRKQTSGYESEIDQEEDEGGSVGKIDHSTAGALYAVQKYKELGRIFAYPIAGHHAGLSDWSYDDSKGRPLHERLEKDGEKLQAAKSGNPPLEIIDNAPDLSQLSKPCIFGPKTPEYMHTWIRMFFSSLVDGDRLDTESFMEPEQNRLRCNYPSIKELKRCFDIYMADKQKDAVDTPINRKRAEILTQCRCKAQEQPGVFTLTVPTGGGKTLSSMGFALEHALKYGKKRIFVVIPYTSIIEQTAEQLRTVFGNESVLEHHCNLNPEKLSRRDELAIENWDAPIIVTTNVQFFESLFAANASACRKIHNIANSVVILDEVQTLPTDFLQPIVSMMKGLVECFKTTLVLCTATQPILNKEIKAGPGEKLSGFEQDQIREIMDDPVELYKNFQRVYVSQFAPTSSQWDEIACEIADQLVNYTQVLCIVSTTAHCRKLFELVRDRSKDGVETIHLSARMCPIHRSSVVSHIKACLDMKKPLRVISTQVVEAGVNIDFPVVYRELAGLDSIAQAAGRCNREGKLTDSEGQKIKGTVFVFDSQNTPPGNFAKAHDACMEVFRHRFDPQKILSPENFEIYFQNYFYRLNSFDKKQIMTLLTNDSGQCKIQFRTAAQFFKMIDDSNQYPLIVRYRCKLPDDTFFDSNSLLKELNERSLASSDIRLLMRKLQRFSITVNSKLFNSLKENDLINEVQIGANPNSTLWTTVEGDLRGNIYDESLGLLIKENEGTGFYV